MEDERFHIRPCGQCLEESPDIDVSDYRRQSSQQLQGTRLRRGLKSRQTGEAGGAAIEGSREETLCVSIVPGP